ncbi:periplasmic component, partial [Paenibacillus sp. A3]
MFDPTIFDNLKVVLEGHLYDLDAEQTIRVIGREDFIDLASMKRIFSMRIRRD